MTTPQSSCSITSIAYGKVRDSAVLSDGRRIIRTSDRISAFDMMMPFTVEGKGACLQRMSLTAFAATKDILPNHIVGCLDERTLLVRNLRVFPIEFVVRRFVTGSLWRMVRQEGAQGANARYGVNLEDHLGGRALTEHVRLDAPICTPTTKSDSGHDRPLSVKDLPKTLGDFLAQHNPGTKGTFHSGADLTKALLGAVIRLFEQGERLAAERDLILVDTKYELGLTSDGELVLADEVHTPDSSRFWTQLPTSTQGPEQLSKEFLREELMRLGIVANDDLTHSGAERLRQVAPELAMRVAERYKDLESRFLAKDGDTPAWPCHPWPVAESDFAAAIAPANQIKRLLMVGNGGRDHTLMSRFATLPGLVSVACTPGGRAWRARQQPVMNWSQRSPESLARDALNDGIDLVLVGPEQPIAEGVAMAMTEAKIPCLAPGPLGASLEASKVHCKTALDAARIPTPRWRSLPWSELKAMTKAPELPCVLKFDGLASGKGVFIIQNNTDWSNAVAEAEHQIPSWMATVRAMRCPSASAERDEPVFLIEECLVGVEYSIFALCNGNSYRFLPIARDYKRRNDGQTGPNTGGMGAVAPLHLDPALFEQFRSAFERLLQHKSDRGEPYKGFLFGGFMVDATGKAQVLEFNCRLGDPETQVIVPGLADEFLLETTRTAQGLPFFWPERSGQFFAHDGLARVFVVGAAPEYPTGSSPHRKLRRQDEEDICPQNPSCTMVPSSIEADGRTAGGRAFGILAQNESIAGARRAAYAEIHAYLLGETKPHYRNDVAAEWDDGATPQNPTPLGTP
jgi:phosphoribosylamine--glycine ligase